LSQPFRWSDQAQLTETAGQKHISDLVQWDIVLAANHVHTAMRDVVQDERWRAALPGLLSDATQLLLDALDLMRELGRAHDREDGSYVLQPSIADHPQNQRYYDWTFLIELVRDAWLTTAETSTNRARLEVERWLTIPYPLFRQLVFFAATETQLFPSSVGLSWLLEEDHWWLWSVETEREAIGLLKVLVPLLTPEDSGRLQGAILEGPPRDMFREGIEPERLQRIIDREIWLRLAKFREAGGTLSGDSTATLGALAAEHPSWRMADDERDEFPVWMGEVNESRAFLATPKRTRELVDWLRENPTASDWQDDDWRDRCQNDFPRAASALLRLAKRGEWIVDRWRTALQAWSHERFAARSWRYIGETLASAPDAVIKELAHALGWWLQAVGKVFTRGENAFFGLIR
jgi:hypothetical protein